MLAGDRTRGLSKRWKNTACPTITLPVKSGGATSTVSTLIFGMDEDNISDLKERQADTCKAKILLLGDYDPQGERIIRDPYCVSNRKTISIRLNQMSFFL